MTELKKIKLVISDHKAESHAGAQELHVTLVDEKLKPAKPIAARLCGGTTTCMAIVETE